MTVARYSGHCPLCSKYIAKGRSKIRALPKAIPLRTCCGRESLDDGGVYHYNGKKIYDWESPRLWVHTKCYAWPLPPLPERGCRFTHYEKEGRM